MKTKIALFLFLILLPLPAFAMTADELAGKLQNSYDKTHDLRADFRQVSVVKSMNMTKEASGTLLIKKPGMLRYSYDKPEKQEIIVKGDDLIMYLPSQNQVIKKTLSRELMDKTPTTFLGGLGKITDSFDPKIPATGEKDKHGRYVLELIPKGDKMGVEEITLALDPKTFDMREFSFRETSGNVNTISLSDVKINKGVKDSAFNFKIPKGASLISE
ncbi:MAG: outer membrane lipoprotein chaperone LolA [Nitrospirota bacterium]